MQIQDRDRNTEEKDDDVKTQNVEAAENNTETQDVRVAIFNIPLFLVPPADTPIIIPPILNQNTHTPEPVTKEQVVFSPETPTSSLDYLIYISILNSSYYILSLCTLYLMPKEKCKLLFCT